MEECNLVEMYREALEGIDPRFLTRGDKNGLSGLFLPSMPEGYASAENKIMVVGCETRAWRIREVEAFSGSSRPYIQACIDKHRGILCKGLNSENGRGKSFFNFMRDVAKRSGGHGLVYSNLLCYSWRGGSPLKCDDFEVIRDYSERLLKAQITFFRPDLIVFANGIASAGVRRRFFPTKGEGKACFDSRHYQEQGISKHHLWAFDLEAGLDRRIPCYRIHHPSARSPEAANAREFLLGLLPRASTTREPVEVV